MSFRQTAQIVACVIASILPRVAVAQTPATAPSGLDSLSDDVLLNDLARRGLSSLLDHAMDADHVAPAQRDAYKTTLSLRQLSDPSSRLTAAERDARAQAIAAGIDQSLSSMTDPAVMSQEAADLIKAGVERNINTLEYWGENPQTQLAIRPVVDAVQKLLDKAAAVARQQADALANTITGPSDPRASQWETLSNLAISAAYTRHMADYYVALSLDRNSPQRKKVADDAITFLAQYDNADSTVQPLVRLRIAKLHMAAGEFDDAKATFASIAKVPSDLQPPPDSAQQWDARYFGAMCDLLAGNIAVAQKMLDGVEQWQAANLPKAKTAQDGAAAATSMLQYRIDAAIADAATDPAAKKQATDRAVAVLIDLVKRRPDLQTIIFQQLMPKLPPDVDLKTLDPLLLQGFIAQADDQRRRPENESPDPAILQRGVDAAREMLRRGSAVDPGLRESAALVIGFFLDRLGRHAEGANAFLDYLRDFPHADSRDQNIALDAALTIIGKLRADPVLADAPDTVKAYERFLPVAVAPPFSRNEFAYEYARRLQLQGKYAEAIEYFRKVPPDDSRLTSARFFQMVALQQLLDDAKLSQTEHQLISNELKSLVDEVTTRVTAALNAAGTGDERTRYRSMLVRTLLLSADVARRDEHDPARTIKLLANFESIAHGLPNEKELLSTALYARVQAYMALGDSTSATQTLVALLKTRPGDEGAAVVYKLLEKLNAELDHAKDAGDAARIKQLAQDRAQLSGFLVEWARSNADPNIRKYTYRYSVFDAATKRMAADLESEPAKRKAMLQAALILYQQLQSEGNYALYQATLNPASPLRGQPDPAVALGIGLISYDLGDYAQAQKQLGQLLTDRKLGTPEMTIDENGQSKQIENDQYWEATLKLMRSNIALADAAPSDATAQAAKTGTVNYLKQLYVLYGRNIGGVKWAPKFESLRQQIAPALNPDEFVVSTTQPTTTP